MGHEIPAALGVRLAVGVKPEVFAFIGDGTYLMNPTEIVTAVQARQKITILISENHGFQVIKRLQMWRVGRAFGNEFRAADPESARLEGDYVELDLAGNARSLGARAWYVRTADETVSALRAAREERVLPCVIVVATEAERYLPSSEAFWDAPPPEVSPEPQTVERRLEYERERRSQRYMD
jgi:3D-(3,5/4)-trihydroxycyclohexane-1,2-dione acylhydrolase (decyclizing)